jgi:hypothetical protein
MKVPIKPESEAKLINKFFVKKSNAVFCQKDLYDLFLILALNL